MALLVSLKLSDVHHKRCNATCSSTDFPLCQPSCTCLGFGTKKSTESQVDEAAVDLNDQDLIEAMEEFALMSEEEMEDAFAEVIEMLGDDAEA
jgi:hypothetical protein